MSFLHKLTSHKDEKNPTEQPAASEDLGYWAILSKLKDLNNSTTIKTQIRNLKKTWKPLIKELTEMAEDIQKKQGTSSTPKTPENPNDPIIQFLNIARDMYKKVDTLATSINYDLYLTSNREEANKIEADNAVILYRDEDGKCYARIVVEKNTALKINTHLNGRVSISEKDYLHAYNTLHKDKNSHNEVELTESNIKQVDEITAKITSAAQVPAPKQDLLTISHGALNLITNELPKLLSAFAKIPIVPILRTLKTKVEENYNKIEDLKKQFSPREKKKENHEPINLTATAQLYIAKVENELKAMLDEKVFTDYFTNKTPSDDQSPWIQQVATIFHTIKELVDKIDQIQKLHPDLINSSDPLKNIEQKINAASDLVSAGIELTAALNQLNENPNLRELISLQKIETQLKISHWFDKANSDTNEIKKMISTIKTATNPLREALNTINILILHKTHASQISVDGATTQAMLNMGNLLSGLENLYNNDDEESISSTNLIVFVIKNLDQILKIKKELPNIQLLLTKLSKEEAKAILNGINSTFNKLILLADKLEIQFSLKDKYLTNKLSPVINSFYETVNKLGYDFTLEERYPFAIDNQRKQLLNNANLPALQKTLIETRQNQKNTPKAQQDEMQNKIHTVISTQIEKLTHKCSQAMKHASDIDKKIDIFTKLQAISNEMHATQPGNLDIVLKKFRHEYPNEIAILYKGNNSHFLKKLELSETDIPKIIAIELANLKKQRGSAYFLNSIEQAKILEERISACENLQLSIKNSNLNDAIKELSSDYQKLLQKYDSAFLDHLTLIEKNLPLHKKPKTILGGVEVKNAKNDSTISVDMIETQSMLVDLISSRLNELNDSFFKTHTKELKISLLIELKKQLNLNYSLESAISRMKTNKDHAKNIHLLFEGNTGKILKMAQNVTMTKNDLVLRLDAEINALKKDRYTHLRVFANPRKHINEQYIEVLQNLRTTINDSKMSLKEIVEHLKPDERNLLQQYEPDLLKALSKLPAAHSPRQK